MFERLDRFVVIAMFVALFTAAPGVSQTISGTAVSSGDREPLSGIRVVLLDQAGEVVFTSETNSEGRFLLPARGEGQYRLGVVARDGQPPVMADPVDGTASAAQVELTVDLEADPARLEVEVLNPALMLAGFYERRSRVTGTYLTRADMIPYRTQTTERVIQRAMSGEQCTPLIMVDGSLIMERRRGPSRDPVGERADQSRRETSGQSGSGGRTADLGGMGGGLVGLPSVAQLTALEWARGQNLGANCGTVRLWTIR